MNIREAETLVRMLATVDRREVTDDVVAAWAVFLEDVDPRDGMAALKHLVRTQTVTIKPAHIVSVAGQIKEDRLRAERMALPKRDAWGNISGSPESIEARARYIEAHRERFDAPPPSRVVSSPFREWEKQRRRHAKRADSPLITDAERIVAMEQERQRALHTLQTMIKSEQRRENADGPGGLGTEAEGEEGV